MTEIRTRRKSRVWKFREETVLVEFVYHRPTESFPKPPALHNERLIVDRTICNLERLIHDTMFFGDPSIIPINFQGIKFSQKGD